MKTLIIDDDPDILEVVSLCFEIRWPEATILTASDGTSGLQTFEREGADIIILDLGLPDIDGLEVCKRLREITDTPIVILTVRNQEKDIVRGLEIGADDYITKPFNQMEFIARANAVLRRLSYLNDEPEKAYADGELVINVLTREVTLRGELVRLTPTEYKLLYHLASNSGKPMTQRDLMAKVWGGEYVDAVDYLKVHIQHLRRKLGDDPGSPRFIATERGIGYKFIAAMSS